MPTGIICKCNTLLPCVHINFQIHFYRQPITKNVAKNLGPTLLSMSGPPLTVDKVVVRAPSPQSRPGSSDGSTTVSANSSPGVDQQEQEELNNARDRKMRMPEMTFKTVDDMYASSGVGAPSEPAPFVFQQQMSTSSSSNGNDEAAAAAVTPKRKSRKQQQ